MSSESTAFPFSPVGLLQRMPLTTLVGNLGKMSAFGLVKPFRQAADLVVRKLKDEALLKRARSHLLAGS